MKILFVIYSLGYGGAESQAIKILNQFIEEGEEVHLVLFSSNNCRDHELSSQIRLDILEESAGAFQTLKRLRAKIRSVNPDVIQSFLYKADLFCKIASIGLDVPLATSERSSDYPVSWRNRAESFLTSWRSDMVVANTRAGKEFQIREFGIPQAKATFVWNGIHTHAAMESIDPEKDLRSELQLRADERVLLFVGSFKPAKDVGLAIRTFHELRRNDDRWKMIMLSGDLHIQHDDYYAEILSLIERLRMREEIVRLTNRKDVYDFMKMADVLLVTSRNEGFPNSVLEAMTVGLPVVSTEYSDITSILPDRTQVAERIPEELASAVERVVERCDDIVAQQKSFVAENCEITVVTNSLKSIFRDIIESK